MPLTEAPASFAQLRDRYRRELLEEQLPFWNRFGMDHENGGFCCSLDYDGRRVNDEKFTWFQGRGLWVYSYVYNHLDASPEHLEVARKTREFLLAHGPQPDGTWASKLARDGTPLAPETDFYGRYFAIEGLVEYSHAAGDEQALETALRMFKELYRQETAADASGPSTQGFWMVNINIARQILERESDPEIREIADRAIDAVIHKHYNPEFGLNNEKLNHDFSRPPQEATKCNFGHSVETLWMVMEEARRRGDDGPLGNLRRAHSASPERRLGLDLWRPRHVDQRRSRRLRVARRRRAGDGPRVPRGGRVQLHEDALVSRRGSHRDAC